MNVLRSIDGDVATFTVSDDYADHRFEVERGPDSVEIDYIESQIGRGMVVSVNVSDEIYDKLTESDSFQEFVSSVV